MYYYWLFLRVCNIKQIFYLRAIIWIHVAKVLQSFQIIKRRFYLHQLSCHSKLSTGFHCSQGRSSTSRLLQSHQSLGCSYKNKQAAWNSNLALLQQIIKQMTLYGKYSIRREAIAQRVNDVIVTNLQFLSQFSHFSHFNDKRQTNMTL